MGVWGGGGHMYIGKLMMMLVLPTYGLLGFELPLLPGGGSG